MSPIEGNGSPLHSRSVSEFWQAAIDDREFLIVPKAVLHWFHTHYPKQIPLTMTLSALYKLGRGKPTFASAQTISEQFGVSERAVKHNLDQLKKLNLIRVHPPRGRRTSEKELAPKVLELFGGREHGPHLRIPLVVARNHTWRESLVLGYLTDRLKHALSKDRKEFSTSTRTVADRTQLGRKKVADVIRRINQQFDNELVALTENTGRIRVNVTLAMGGPKTVPFGPKTVLVGPKTVPEGTQNCPSI